MAAARSKRPPSAAPIRLWLAVAMLAAACAHGLPSGPPARAPTSPAEPAIAPTPTARPVGRVLSVGNAPEGIAVGTSGIAAVAVRNPDGVVLIDVDTGAVRRTVPTTGAARHLSLATPGGPVLAPLEGSNQLMALAFPDGVIASVVNNVGRQPHDAAMTRDGTVVVTNEAGGGVVFIRDGGVVKSLPAGPVQPGGVAAVGGYAAVADVQGNGVWVYDGSTRLQVAHAPVGLKLTHAVSLSGDLAAFADTEGGAVLVERVNPQVSQVTKIDAPGKPYGLAYDAAGSRLFVTLTASNVLRVIDVSDVVRPRTLGDLPTIRQPNSVAVDPRSGAVLVTGSGASGEGGVQIITADLVPTN